MSSSSLDDLGKLVLRLSLGIMLLLHGVAKLGGVAWLSSSLASHGLPGFIAYGVYLGEILAPLLIILGVYTRLGGIIVIINMLFAIGLMHMGDIFSLSKTGGWAIELQGMYLFGGLVIALLGAGSLGLGGRNGRWN